MVKTVKKAKATHSSQTKQRIRKGTLRSAFVASLKAESGRPDIAADRKFASKGARKTFRSVPNRERAGYPVKRLKGSVAPEDWVTNSGDKIHVDLSRAHWLPDEWGQGVKITHMGAAARRAEKDHGSRGVLTCFVAPDGKNFFHKHLSEEHSAKMGWTKKFTPEAGKNGQIQLAKAQAMQALRLMREELREGQEVEGVDKDSSLFRLLSAKERRALPDKSELHFCVVSARRASSFPGLGDVFVVQRQLQEAGVDPTWYVDAESAKDYRALGFRVKVGGKLTESRNRALQDAKRLGKVCVQLSDDISGWVYMDGPQAKVRTDDACNAAHSAARRIVCSPVAAARFMLAKMRSGAPFVDKNFILGDFFVVDGGDVKFDPKMTLKEDYDFTCSHLKAYGCVLRCQRMTLCVKHYSNAGGACSNRDKKGLEEKRNIAILNEKWPGVFRPNPKRNNEVIMRWKTNGVAAEGEDEEADGDGDPGGDASGFGARPRKRARK
ncbi:unnamed protein product [Prorocentrum cordatum]|uniref:Uncharacterized protein n=1 Tax=Prorocentrum cordatum TaxID=2364126 RepID=A0ABN9WVQ4_9DINO|nr:unnamed protein product [Polarella glacialis]